MSQERAVVKRSPGSKQSPANDNKLRMLHAQGKTAREMAKELGVTPSTIARWCKRLGLTNDHTQLVAATARSGVDLAAGRIRLAEKMLRAAETMLDRIDEPYLVYNFGGKDNEYNEHLLTEAPVEVKRNILTSAAISFDKITRIVEADPDIGTAETAIRAIQRGLLAAAKELQLDPDTKTLLDPNEDTGETP